MSNVRTAVPTHHEVVDATLVQFYIGVYNGILVHGQKADSALSMSYVTQFLKTAATGTFDPAYVTAGARREARAWLIELGISHLDLVNTWFE